MYTPLVIFMVLVIVLLVVTMILCAKSASDINKNSLPQAHKASTTAAILCGISILSVVSGLIYYVYKAKHNRQ